jgi:translation initiation factor IF-3
VARTETDEALELERGEDLDLVQVSEAEVPDPRILEQFKMRSEPLNRSKAYTSVNLTNRNDRPHD